MSVLGLEPRYSERATSVLGVSHLSSPWFQDKWYGEAEKAGLVYSSVLQHVLYLILQQDWVRLVVSLMLAIDKFM